jgi:dCTP deaminase
MFWSGETLKERLPTLSPDFKPDAIDCNAWMLTIGSRIYKTPTAAEAKVGSHSIQTLAENASFQIPPGQFAFLETRETVKIPRDVMGFISIKAKIKWQGLVRADFVQSGS